MNFAKAYMCDVKKYIEEYIKCYLEEIELSYEKEKSILLEDSTSRRLEIVFLVEDEFSRINKVRFLDGDQVLLARKIVRDEEGKNEIEFNELIHVLLFEFIEMNKYKGYPNLGNVERLNGGVTLKMPEECTIGWKLLLTCRELKNSRFIAANYLFYFNDLTYENLNNMLWSCLSTGAFDYINKLKKNSNEVLSRNNYVFTRNQVYRLLMEYGFTEEEAFKMSERIRKGIGLSESEKTMLLSRGVNDETIKQLKYIKYLCNETMLEVESFVKYFYKVILRRWYCC